MSISCAYTEHFIATVSCNDLEVKGKWLEHYETLEICIASSTTALESHVDHFMSFVEICHDLIVTCCLEDINYLSAIIKSYSMHRLSRLSFMPKTFHEEMSPAYMSHIFDAL